MYGRKEVLTLVGNMQYAGQDLCMLRVVMAERRCLGGYLYSIATIRIRNHLASEFKQGMNHPKVESLSKGFQLCRVNSSIEWPSQERVISTPKMTFHMKNAISMMDIEKKIEDSFLDCRIRMRKSKVYI